MQSSHRAKWEMIEAGGRTAQSFGLNRLFGQIYTLLYLSHEEQSLEDLAAGLGVSKASVSIACRQLESWGAVHKAWKKGDRKDYYEAERDFSAILKNGLLVSVLKKLDSAKIQIDRSLALLGEDQEASSEQDFIREKLAEAERFRSRLEGLLHNPLVRKFL